MPNVEHVSILPPRFAEYLSGLSDVTPKRGLGPYPGLAARPFWDASEFSLVRRLERDATVVLRELRSVGDADFVPEREQIRRRGRWDVAFLSERGRPHAGLRARCPVTSAAIDDARTIRGPSGLAYLSRLCAASHVAPHRGPTNVRLRCHFGVDIPDDCGLVVGGETRRWTEGRCLVFDDSFEHEAWNRDVRDRLVLIVDVWHPDLGDDEIRLLAGLDTFVEARTANLQRYFERNRS